MATLSRMAEGIDIEEMLVKIGQDIEDDNDDNDENEETDIFCEREHLLTDIPFILAYVHLIF
jgi:hypothetical protein